MEQSDDEWIQLVVDNYHVALGSSLVGLIADCLIMGIILSLWYYWRSHRSPKESKIQTGFGVCFARPLFHVLGEDDRLSLRYRLKWLS